MDRNKRLGLLGWLRTLSLSARRAWIEIRCLLVSAFTSFVALRKESVDRNSICLCWIALNHPSLSARRAWIEMLIVTVALDGKLVALRKESVDRNRQSA